MMRGYTPPGGEDAQPAQPPSRAQQLRDKIASLTSKLVAAQVVATALPDGPARDQREADCRVVSGEIADLRDQLAQLDQEVDDEPVE
jgi:hypothetical protein